MVLDYIIRSRYRLTADVLTGAPAGSHGFENSLALKPSLIIPMIGIGPLGSNGLQLSFHWPALIEQLTNMVSCIVSHRPQIRQR